GDAHVFLTRRSSELAAMSRMWSTMSGITAQPSGPPVLIGTYTRSASPSPDGSGSPTRPSMVTVTSSPVAGSPSSSGTVLPSIAANASMSSATARRSASVMPPSRSYTTTAGIVSESENASLASSARVDSASPGSQEEASLFSTSESLPAPMPPTMTTATQNKTTSHLIRRPQTAAASRLPMVLLQSGAVG